MVTNERMPTHYIDRNPDRIEAEIEIKRDRIRNLTEDEILEYIDLMEQYWCLKEGMGNNSHLLGYRQLIPKHHLDPNGWPEQYDMTVIDGNRGRIIRSLSELSARVRELGIADSIPNAGGDEMDADLKLSRKINRLVEQVKDGFKNINLHLLAYNRSENPMKDPEIYDADPATFRGVPMDDSKIDDASPFQKCILCALDRLYTKKYRRYKTDCCEQIVYDGHNTRAWKPAESIEQFVYNLGSKEEDFGLWQNLTNHASTFRNLIDHLTHCQDVQFPQIKKDRHMWSFHNGVFLGKVWCPDTGMYKCEFYPYESEKFRCLDPSKVSCKFFDVEFDNYDDVKDWYDIPTPHFQGVLDYQKFEPDVCKWMYIMGGRLCYNVGEMDGWQVIPFLKGIARSGKSTLITKVFKKFYGSDDVKTMSNNIEKKFGLGSIYDAQMFIAPEIKGDFCLEQAEFQSMVSGEDVSVAIKGKTAKSIEWTCPGVLGGNEVPNWKDNSGSVLRRILPWNFAKQVKEADTKLDEKLNAEIPVILLKCIRAYLEYSQKYSNKDIWNITPEYFKTIQKQVAMVASTLHNFMESTNLVYGPELFVPQKLFVQVFNQHCLSNNLGKPKFNPDFYAGPFSSRDIEVRTAVETYEGRTYPLQPFIYGLDVVKETLEFGDDH